MRSSSGVSSITLTVVSMNFCGIPMWVRTNALLRRSFSCSFGTASIIALIASRTSRAIRSWLVSFGDGMVSDSGCRMKAAAEPGPHLSGAATLEGSSQSLPAGTFGPLLQREAYRAYLDYLAEREANEPSDAVRSALATEQVKVSVEQRVCIPQTTMLVLETEWDYQRFGLDRRALASILTIDAGGVGTLAAATHTRRQQVPRDP